MTASVWLTEPAGTAYLERRVVREPWYARSTRGLVARLGGPYRTSGLRLQRAAARIEALAGDYASTSDAELQSAASRCAHEAHREGLTSTAGLRLFAIVREAAERVLGTRPYRVQLMGGWALLRGLAVEMQTGEGKTLTATLPAVTAGLAGVPVHVVTANDYLAERDAETMTPLYAFFGLEVGVVCQGVAKAARRHAYACPVTYCTNKELVFDYLRDRIATRQVKCGLQLKMRRLNGRGEASDELLLNGLHFAIVDEADSVFIDEARTPLIISQGGSAGEEARVYSECVAMAAQLVSDNDFSIHAADKRVRLTDAGKERLAELCKGGEPPWNAPRRREELVVQALTALHLYAPGEAYVVQDGKVQIVDEFTGRIYADRSWEAGLHQMIEAKEGVEITAERTPLARISYQRFFRRYRILAGMSGTLREVRGELRQTYGLETVRIPTNRPGRRDRLPARVCADQTSKWQAVVARVEALRRAGRPVLIGTRSVAASEALAEVLIRRGVEHVVLNAIQDADEADIVARAGEAGRVTVATNMAGRGTDIGIDAAVETNGGLHVIATELHEAGRIDRQLFGRAARQGQRGSCEAILAADDEIVSVHGNTPVRTTLRAAAGASAVWQSWCVRYLFRFVQWRVEREHLRVRAALLSEEQRLDDALAFAGLRE